MLMSMSNIYTLGLDRFPEIVSAANQNDVFKFISYIQEQTIDVIPIGNFHSILEVFH
jgi:hypothetical protein